MWENAQRCQLRTFSILTTLPEAYTMNLFTRILASAFAVALTTSPAYSQALPQAEGGFHVLHNVELGGGAIGQFTPVLPTHNAGATQSTTDSFGGLFTFKDHPVSWAGIELNYGFSEFTERYGSPANFRVKTAMHEATGAYIFHPHLRKMQPFLALGGGYIGFMPALGSTQWRGTGLAEVGFDVPTSNPHMGFRFQGRALVYRAPNYYNGAVGTVNWVATTEPMAGVWYRW
jgi:hypothetical protein